MKKYLNLIYFRDPMQSILTTPQFTLIVLGASNILLGQSIQAYLCVYSSFLKYDRIQYITKFYI